MHQCRLHTDEDHGRQCANRLLGPARRRLRHSLRARQRRHGRNPPAQAEQLWTTFARESSVAWKTPRTSSSFSAKGDFTGPKVVEVKLKAGGTRTLTADTIFINTGARPARPRIAGLDSVTALDSTSIMELQELPEHLLILGGGYVGLEFGQMFRRFGSAVTVVQHGKQLLGREDADVAAEVCKLLQTDGIEILLETEAVGVHASASGVGLELRGPAGERTVTGSHLLLAAGRVPNSERLNLAAAGVNVDARGFIPVERPAGDERRRHLRFGGHQRRPGVYAHLVRRLSHHPQQPASRRAVVDEGPTGSVHRVH